MTRDKSLEEYSCCGTSIEEIMDYNEIIGSAARVDVSCGHGDIDTHVYIGVYVYMR